MRYLKNLFATVLTGLAFLSGASHASEKIPQIVLDAMSGMDVVILGEVHDNPNHHQIQAAAVSALAPRAVVWEMLTKENAAKINRQIVSDPAELASVLRWAESGWPPFSMYLPIFEAATDARSYGALVPRAAARRALETGAAAAFGAEADRFGLNSPLPPDEQAAREADQHAAHCEAMPIEMMPQMVEIQRLRDAVLARATLDALEDTGGPVFVITGNGHARMDRGVPVMLKRMVPGLRLYVLGQSEDGVIAGEFDGVIDSPAPDREDPCAAFS
ncbi:MAG: ChaN family lipoprotein [Pseudomonadota bacterium]